jgi:hypothetical protein
MHLIHLVHGAPTRYKNVMTIYYLKVDAYSYTFQWGFNLDQIVSSWNKPESYRSLGLEITMVGTRLGRFVH